MVRDSPDRSESPVRNRGSSRRSPYRREKSPARHRSSHSARSPGRERQSTRIKSPVTNSPGERHVSSTRHRSRSNPAATRARDETNKSRGNHSNDDDDSVARMRAAEEALDTKEKQKPSFELSGKLASETNQVNGVRLLFPEPPDARKPDISWRLSVFKGGELLNEPIYVDCKTRYLFGREKLVADIPTYHQSCSRQHAVLQYRQVEKEPLDGILLKQVRPYLMDLGSEYGTFINDHRIKPQCYYELIEKDVIKFGDSSRVYVLLHEKPAG